MKTTKLQYNTVITRVKDLSHPETPQINYARVGWVLNIESTEYGLKSFEHQILNITLVDNGGDEHQVDLKDENTQLTCTTNTDGITMFGFMPDTLQIRGNDYLINFK